MIFQESGLTGLQRFSALQNFWIRKAKLATSFLRQAGPRAAFRVMHASSGQLSEMIRRSSLSERALLVRQGLAVFDAAHMVGYLDKHELGARQHILISFAGLSDRAPLVADAAQAWQRAYQKRIVSFKQISMVIPELELFAGVQVGASNAWQSELKSKIKALSGP